MLWLFTAQPQTKVSTNSVPKGLGKSDTLDVSGWNAPRVAAAKRHFRRAIALDPGNNFARGWLERLGCDSIESQPVASGLMALDDEEDEEEGESKEGKDIIMAKDEDDDLIVLPISMDVDSEDDLDKARPSKRARGYTE
ncbi:unnamed protein product [Rhizoctonia solani]|uniref:Uncharacterized protein n=1 Tax=Rhizoctonia solani TaxID=456999 RepID=A0A8H2XFT4_9AGAM|nr:unnamed protein product [Rhizoctonia solani]